MSLPALICGARLGLAPPQVTLPAVPTTPGELAHRDPFGVPNVVLSEHFAAHYGPESPVGDEAMVELLAAFEQAYDEGFALGHLPPAGAGRDYLNVYVGNSGGGAPTIDFVGAIVYRYDESAPDSYVVVHPDLLTSRPAATFLEFVVPHEYHHVLQNAAGAFPHEPDRDAPWIREASADWFAAQLFPRNEFAAFGAGDYARMPWLPVGRYDWSDEALSRRQYASWIFLQHLGEHQGGEQLVVDLWNSGTLDDPLDAIDARLAEDGRSLAEVLPQFAAHNAVWDYAEGELYEEALDGMLDGEPDTTHVAVQRGLDAPWTVTPKPKQRPQAAGYNLVRLNAPPEAVAIALTAAEAGSEGTPTSLAVAAVVDFRDHFEHRTLAADAVSGTWTIDGLADAKSVTIALAATAADRVPDESFDWELILDLPADPPADSGAGAPEDEAHGGCGCDAGGRGASLPALALLALAFRRRAASR